MKFPTLNGEFDKTSKEKLDDCQMITTKSLNPNDEEVERNLKLVKESEVKAVKLFKDFHLRLVRIRKNLPNDFK